MAKHFIELMGLLCLIALAMAAGATFEAQGWPIVWTGVIGAFLGALVATVGLCLCSIDRKPLPPAPHAAGGDFIQGLKKDPHYAWRGDGPEPAKWTAPDGTVVYRSYADYVED